MKKFLDGLKFGLGFMLACAVAVPIFFGGAHLIDIIYESNLEETRNPSIEINSINHWTNEDKLIFVGIAENKSDQKWESLAIHFVVKGENGELIGQCSEILERPEFPQTGIPFEAKCYDVPKSLKKYTYTIEMFGRYKKT